MNTHRYVIALISTLIISISQHACSGASQKTAATSDSREIAAPENIPTREHHTDEAEHEELPSKVQVSKQVIAASGIKLLPATKENLPNTVDVSGEVVVDPDRAAAVTARAPGRIVEVRFKEGQKVTAGSILAILESSDLAHARSLYTSAQAKATVARQNAERLANLSQKGLSSGQEVEATKAEAISAEAEAKAARESLSAFGASAATSTENAARLELRAPIEGYILKRNAIVGQSVAPDTVLAEIARFDEVYFVGRLFEKDLVNVKTGGAAEVRLNAYPSDNFPGTLESIGRQIDATARTVTARIRVRNHDDRLKAGLFGTARITIESSEATRPRLVVPLTAVTHVADRKVVFVQHADGDFEVHPVTLGRSASGKIEVITGLREGEQVVVEGVFTLKSAVLKSAFGEEE